jgi:hypothetical protein
LNENENIFFKNFDFIDKTIVKNHQEIHDWLLEMFPQAKNIIDYHQKDKDGKPFSEWRRMIFEIDNYILSGPKSINSHDIKMDKETIKDRQEKFDKYLKDRNEGKPAQYFRNDTSDPRLIDFNNLPPVTILNDNGIYEVIDGAHRVFLAQKSNKPLNAYIWNIAKNNHPNVIKIKSLFKTQNKVY